MTTTSTSTSGLRCPRCAAAVPLAAPWCSLCFADLRPAPVPAVPAVPAAPGRHARRPDAVAAAVRRTDGLPPETAAQVETLLAELRGAGTAQMGRLAGLVGSPARKAAVMIGGSLTATLVLVLVMALAGALL